MSKVLRGGIIGLGRMGLTHYSILNCHPALKLVSICDSSSLILKNMEKYTDLAIFENYEEMYNNMQLDFIIIATPTSLHAGAVKSAIRNNIHIFVEKPFTLNVNEGSEIVDMLNGKRLVNQVGYVNRFNEIFSKVKNHLQDGLIGDIVSFKMEIYGPTVLKDSKTSWRSKKAEGGGCLHDFASHGIDLINYLIGPPNRVSGSVLQSIHSANVEDAAYSTFLYKNNYTGNLIVNWSDPSFRKPSYRIYILGRYGKIIADLHGYKIYFKDTPQSSEYGKGWNTRYITDLKAPVRFYVRGNEFTKQLDYFIDCILNNSPRNICSFKEGLITDEIIESIIRDSADRGTSCLG
jgi:predicted dehydrogenase